jgi:hypothetical protein
MDYLSSNYIQVETCFWCGLRVEHNLAFKVKLYDMLTSLYLCKGCLEKDPKLMQYVNASEE